MEEKLGISFGSINTGLPKDIVQQLIAAEKIPITKMETKKAKILEKTKLVGELYDLLSKIRGEVTKSMNARSLRELKYDTDENMIDVALDKNVAQPGNYQLEVLQLAQKSSAMTSGFADKENSNVGVGFIQYSLPNGDEREIYIDSDNSSLDSIAKLINRDSESGLRANVIDDGSGSETPYRLVLSLDATGDEMSAEFPYFYFVDGDQDFYLEFERPGHDAKIKFDGFEMEVPNNRLTDLIPGVTIDLKQAKPGHEFSLKISEDLAAITEKIVSLVESINEVIKFIKDQNALDQNSDTTRTLGGDIMLTSLEGRIRSAVFQGIGTEFGSKRFGDLGVEFLRTGLLKLDEAKFEASLSGNYKMVSQILTGYVNEEGMRSNGFMDNLDNVLNNSLRTPDGLLTSRKRSLGSKIEQIDRRIDSRERIIKQKEENLKQKFSRLEGTIARIKNSGAGIASLNNGAANIANPAPQLG